MTPENPVIAMAARQDYDGFYALELPLRQLRGCPPFADLMTVTFTGLDEDRTAAGALRFREMLQGAPLLMGELTGDLKALVDEKSAIISGWVESGRLAPVDPQHLIFMIWATTQHYADFATQVEAVTGATLRDETFFQQTVDNVQRMIIEGIRVR